MSPKSDRDKNSAGNISRVRGNLGAIGAAAVLTVYSAGFARTKAAADRFAAEDMRRNASSKDASVPAAARSVATQVAASIIAVSKTSAAQSEVHPNATSNKPHGATSALPRVKKKTATAQKSDEKVATVEATSAADPVAPESETPVAPAPPSVTEPPADTVTPARTTAKYKDGTFLGWGSSRHGDIQASVEIRNGLIVAAKIVQCRTQYSCTRIDALPPEVVERQSAEVDYVSRATQSSNAFYYAVQNALAQAK